MTPEKNELSDFRDRLKELRTMRKEINKKLLRVAEEKKVEIIRKKIGI